MKKEVLIFGANGALGKGVTKVLSSGEYDKIYLFARNSAEINTLNNKSEIIEVKNIGDEQNVKDVFTKIRPSVDKLFFLYSSIGGFTGGKEIADTSIEDFDRMINVNIRTNFLLAKYFTKLVKESAGGSICFTSAYVGLFPEAGKGVYGMTKAALIHLVKTLAKEGTKYNFTANAVAPFVIDTPENRTSMKKEDIEKALKSEEIGKTINEIFYNFHFINGNIFQMKDRLSIQSAADK